MPVGLSFRQDVMPVLSKAGCNAGACHGYSLGKNGFKLSLRGADPEKDYLALTDEFAERRINRNNPDASLLLLKPLGDLPHEGGVRMDRGSMLARDASALDRGEREGRSADLAEARRGQHPSGKSRLPAAFATAVPTRREIQRWLRPRCLPRPASSM